MEIVENRPFEHNFSVSGNDDNLPENLGHFETIDDFQEHFAINTVSEHQKVTAVRHYTDEEILEFREEILRVAEDQLPEAKENYSQKDIEFKQAKEAKEIAGEVVGALQTKISDLAAEIKEGKTEIEVHHITYYIAGQSIRGKELHNLKWLVTVCNKHHKEIHQDINHPFNPKNKQKRNAETY
ncbi:hypothetical protein HZQ14_15685 [Elizabethkingia anophelis]|nr:hypothetical protein [Elizabethkingia anophelis]